MFRSGWERRSLERAFGQPGGRACEDVTDLHALWPCRYKRDDGILFLFRDSLRNGMDDFSRISDSRHIKSFCVTNDESAAIGRGQDPAHKTIKRKGTEAFFRKLAQQDTNRVIQNGRTIEEQQA